MFGIYLSIIEVNGDNLSELSNCTGDQNCCPFFGCSVFFGRVRLQFDGAHDRAHYSPGS